MKHLFFLLFILLSSGTYAGNKVLFEIGKQDNSAAKFALYPDNYNSFLANFGGEKSFYVGYSSAGKHRDRWIAGPAADIGPGFIPAISLLYFLIWIRSLRRENVP